MIPLTLASRFNLACYLLTTVGGRGYFVCSTLTSLRRLHLSFECHFSRLLQNSFVVLKLETANEQYTIRMYMGSFIMSFKDLSE